MLTDIQAMLYHQYKIILMYDQCGTYECPYEIRNFARSFHSHPERLSPRLLILFHDLLGLVASLVFDR